MKADLKFTFVILLIVSVFGCKKSEAQIEVVNAFPNLEFEQVIDIQSPNDESNRLFIVSQPGVIYSIPNHASASGSDVFLDITAKVLSGGEQGLLGLAFHPDYAANGYFYLNYTASNPRRTIIARYNVSSGNPQKADEQSELIILTVEQPYSNHNGGQIVFGPDGYLYISFGDGGSGGDPENNGQNRQTLLGSIARIDINNTDGNLNYSIPESNPFKGNTMNYKEEIYAYGLRNVWRFSFDGTGKLWAADVGQNAWEEIHLIESGKNYGWRIMEGNHCYNPASGCNQTGLELPIWEYGHNSEGGYSITGGFVYEGTEVEELKNKYVYADFVSGNIWALKYDGSTIKNELLMESDYRVSTFGVDNKNEIYFADYTGGRIYKFKSSVSSSSGDFQQFDYRLDQNYPNPFNPNTTINYNVGETAVVEIKVFNTLGMQQHTLISTQHLPGNYSLQFSGEELASGVYYYQMVTDNYAESRKMLLLK